MPQRTVRIENSAAALDKGHGPLGRKGLNQIIQTEMAAAVDRWLESLEAEDAADRRAGYYWRSLLTEFGDIELSVPHTLRYCPTKVLRACVRRSPEIDRMILGASSKACSQPPIGCRVWCP